MKPLVLCTTLLVETSPQALPLGAACVCSALKADKKCSSLFESRLLDFSLEQKEFSSLSGIKEKALFYSEKILSAKNSEQKLFAVCFSVYVWNRHILEQCAAFIKEKDSSIICIAGGPEATANPFSFKKECFDYAVAGAGELAVPALLSSEQKDFSMAGVYDLAKAKEEQVIMRSPLCPPEDIPSPYLDGTIDPAKYGGALWELARGCPFKCSYCYESKGESRISYFPKERLYKEIALFAKKKISQVFVLDPTYNADKKRATEMISYIKEHAPGMFFYFEARAEFIDRPLAKAFASITCALQIGLQSSNEQVLKNVHRTFNKKLFSKNIGILNEEGVVFGFDLIYGLPGDNLKGFKESIDFALQLYPNNLELFRLSVLPGTDLYERRDALGLNAMEEAPYSVIETSSFSKAELALAESLARATNIFYTQGRAVSWFNSVLYPLKMRPSAFLHDFELFLKEKKLLDEELSLAKIRLLQKEFVSIMYKKKHLDNLLLAVNDLISFFGALSDADGEALSSSVQLHYWPEDLLSEYALDLQFFCANAQRHNSTVKVRPSPSGAVWN